jgi:hypothetical protein
MSKEMRRILITGASRGLGQAMAIVNNLPPPPFEAIPHSYCFLLIVVLKSWSSRTWLVPPFVVGSIYYVIDGQRIGIGRSATPASAINKVAFSLHRFRQLSRSANYYLCLQYQQYAFSSVDIRDDNAVKLWYPFQTLLLNSYRMKRLRLALMITSQVTELFG